MLAAYPSANSPKECQYGARHRTNWYDQTLFVHPLRSDCEVRFKYKDNGEVVAANKADQGVIETIKQLNLNDKELVKWREQVIHTALFEEKLTKGQMQRIKDAMERRDSNGNFREFCFVIKQACERYLQRIG